MSLATCFLCKSTEFRAVLLEALQTRFLQLATLTGRLVRDIRATILGLMETGTTAGRNIVFSTGRNAHAQIAHGPIAIVGKKFKKSGTCRMQIALSPKLVGFRQSFSSTSLNISVRFEPTIVVINSEPRCRH